MVPFEIVYYMKRKSRGNRGEVTLKVDINEVYDRVDWSFLRLVMLKLGFAPCWVGFCSLLGGSNYALDQYNTIICSLKWD